MRNVGEKNSIEWQKNMIRKGWRNSGVKSKVSDRSENIAMRNYISQ